MKSLWLVCFWSALFAFEMKAFGKAEMSGVEGVLSYVNPDKEIIGIWHGGESCIANSTRDANLLISAVEGKEVLISGFYTTNGYVRGTRNGNTITIPVQKVTDGDFDITISGIINISDNQQYLGCTMNIEHNGIQDICENAYWK